eukprot:356944-Chlamydomonas_euryale.AAC.5
MKLPISSSVGCRTAAVTCTRVFLHMTITALSQYHQAFQARFWEECALVVGGALHSPSGRIAGGARRERKARSLTSSPHSLDQKARRCDHRTAPTSARHCGLSCARQYHYPPSSTRSSRRVALAQSIHRRLG